MLCKLMTFMVMLASAATGAHAQYEIEEAFPDLYFDQLTGLENAGDGSDRLFTVEQDGLIRAIHGSGETATRSLFLDISGRIDSNGGEKGLLGLAFHPNYAFNGWFYVNYTASDPARTVISRFLVSEDSPDSADPESELVLLEFLQPYTNHNGGHMAFGPDGYLYIAAGDGGSGGDPDGNGQNRATLLGSILRIDVDNPANGLNYGIPPDNPFAGNTDGYREEIYAYGLRNTWRFSFDHATGKLWAGDVGQGAREEIDIIVSGGNYGWNTMEGFACYSPSDGCSEEGLQMPVWDYPRSEGISVTGGYVYRGRNVPDLVGRYVYGDFGSGRIWALDRDEEGAFTNEELLESGFNISSFGVGEDGELYILNYGGKIYRFTPATTVGVEMEEPLAFTLHGNHPNPFNPATTITYTLENAGEARLSVFNAAGQKVEVLRAGVHDAGSHAIVWNAGDMPSGVYFYRLEADGREAYGKMLLMK